jgi:hypothetical protein
VAALTWQEAKRRRLDPGPTYGVEDAIEFIHLRLDPSTRERLGLDGVRRVIEWEIYYLQGLAQDNRRNPVQTVAGGYGPAVDFIIEQNTQRHRITYARADVEAVLRQEAAYLEAIGAVGDVVKGEEL